jgi:hypothetical protein
MYMNESNQRLRPYKKISKCITPYLTYDVPLKYFYVRDLRFSQKCIWKNIFWECETLYSVPRLSPRVHLISRFR